MTQTIRTTLLPALLVAFAAACSGKPDRTALASDLQSDLDAATSSSVELANGGAPRTEVVSAAELTGAPARAAQPRPRANPATAPRAARTPTAAPAPAAAPQVAEQPRPEPPPAMMSDTLAPITPRPTPSAPAATRSRRGGYKTVGEIIRDAPFPINP